MTLADENTCDCRQYEVDRINAAVLKAIKQIGELAERKYGVVKRDNSGQKEAATRLEREIGQIRQRILQKKTEKQDCYERYILEEADRNQYLAVKQVCDAEIEAAEKRIAEWSKEMAMQAEVNDEQLKELENISLFAREPALTKEMVEAMIKEVEYIGMTGMRLSGSLEMYLMRWLAREGRPFRCLTKCTTIIFL